jgi:hypothetical protein
LPRNELEQIFAEQQIFFAEKIRLERQLAATTEGQTDLLPVRKMQQTRNIVRRIWHWHAVVAMTCTPL